MQEACVNPNHCDFVLVWYIFTEYYSVSELNTFYGDNTALIGNTLPREVDIFTKPWQIASIRLLTCILICIPVFRFVKFIKFDKVFLAP